MRGRWVGFACIALLLGGGFAAARWGFEPPAPIPSLETVELVRPARILGAGALRTLVYDADHPPALRLRPVAPEGLQLQLVTDEGAQTLGFATRVRSDDLIIDAEAPRVTRPGPARLDLVQRGRVVGTWAIEWAQTADDVVSVRAARALVAADRAAQAVRRLEAEPSTVSWAHFHAQVELGRIQRNQGHGLAAEVAWAKAAELAEELGSASEVAGRLRALAFLDLQAGTFARARARLDQAEDLSESVGDAQGLARLMHYEALWLQRRGAPMLLSRVRQTFHRALEAAWQSGDDRDAALFAALFAALLAEYGAFDEAEALFDRYVDGAPLDPSERLDVDLQQAVARRAALAEGVPGVSATDLVDRVHRLHARAVALHLPRSEAFALVELVQLALMQGQAAEAARHLERLHRLPEDAQEGYRWLVEMDELEADLLRGRLEGLEERIERVRASLDRTEVGEDLDFVVMLDGLLGELRAQTGDHPGAVRAFERALSSAQTLTRRFALPRARTSYRRRRRAALMGLVGLRLKSGTAAQALQLVEQDRAETLHTLEVQARTASAPEAWSSYQQHRLQDAARFPEGCQALVGTQEAEPCRAAERATEAVLHEAWVQGWTVSRDGPESDLDRRLWTGPGVAALSVFRLRDTWVSFLARDGGVSAKVLDGDPVEVWQEELQTVKRLYVSPGQSPSAFGLAWKREGQGRLGARVQVLLLPHFMRPSVASSTPVNGPWLIIADPSGDLPQTQAEVEEITMGRDGVERLEGDRARWAQVTQGWTQARRIHFAGHGRTHDRDPWRAELVLYDGRFTLHDMLVHPTHAELVVLNGCRTGPQMYSAEIGIPQVLVSGGAGYVLATTTDVADNVARRFVTAFYEAGAVEDPPGAFRRVVATAGDTEPGFASFRLWGRPQPRRTPNTNP